MKQFISVCKHKSVKDHPQSFNASHLSLRSLTQHWTIKEMTCATVKNMTICCIFVCIDHMPTQQSIIYACCVDWL